MIFSPEEEEEEEEERCVMTTHRVDESIIGLRTGHHNIITTSDTERST